MNIGGDPTGIRTRVTGVRGQRPKPLDDGTFVFEQLPQTYKSDVSKSALICKGRFLFTLKR